MDNLLANFNCPICIESCVDTCPLFIFPKYFISSMITGTILERFSKHIFF